MNPAISLVTGSRRELRQRLSVCLADRKRVRPGTRPNDASSHTFLGASSLWLFISLLSAVPYVPSGALSIIIIGGEGQINNIKQRTAREPVTQVEDENHRPVADATVVFTLPSAGPGGVFANGAHTMTVKTDSNGSAVARGLRPNTIAGQYQIHVVAAYDGQSASAIINQTNALLAAAGSVGAGPSWVHRLTGWTALLHGRREEPGYGLYSYLLLAAPPNQVISTRLLGPRARPTIVQCWCVV